MKVKMHTDEQKKILILSANPLGTPQLRLDEEVRDIEEGLQRSKYRDQFAVDQKMAVRLRDLRRALLDAEPQILHFTGHGEIEGILVEDKNGYATLVPPRALAGLFKLLSGRMECVILSACYSDHQAAAINKHIKYVIAMPQEIRDKAALEFAVGFYDALGAGKTVEEAHDFGCNAIQQYCPDLPDFIYPRLQVNPRIKIKKKKKFLIPFIAAVILLIALFAGLHQDNSPDHSKTTYHPPAQKTTTIDPPRERVETPTEKRSAKPVTPSPKSEPVDGPMVYITPSGKKYHRKSCYHIKYRSNKEAVTLKYAKDNKRRPCKTCRPPE